MNTINIRDARIADIPALAALSSAAFTENFQSLYTKDILTEFLASYHSEDYYHRTLSDTSACLFVAEQSGGLVAYAKTRPNSLPCKPSLPNTLELSRLYVLRAFTGRGLGHDFMINIYTNAKRQGYSDIVLSVFSENFGAQRFYERYGFTKIGDHKFRVSDNHFDDNWILRKTLTD